jgi:MFS family permease
LNTTTATQAPSAQKSGLLINRNYALRWSGQTISIIGDFVFTTTLVVWIAVDLSKGQAWAPLAVSGVLIAASLPVLLVGPLAGVFVDRWDKRGTILRMTLLQAAAVASLLLASGIVPLPFIQGGRLPLAWTLGAIYAVVFLVNAFGQFANPASLALIGDIVSEPDRPRAMGLAQVSGALATIVGPPLAAPLLLTFGVHWALIIDALSFLVAFATVTAIRAPRAMISVAPGQRGSFAGELRAGIDFFFGNRVLVTLLVALSIAMLGAGALNALDVFFVTQNLHTDAHLYGVVGAAQAVGILIGAAVAGTLAVRAGLGRTIWASLIAVGITLLVWARMTSFVPALGVLFVGGIAQAALNVAAAPLLLRVTPKALIGRATAVVNPVITLASLISIALAGYLDSTVLAGFHATIYGLTFGPVDTIFAVAGVLVLLGGLYAMVMLRGVDAPSTEAAPAADARAVP